MIPLLLDHLWQSTLFAAAVGLLTVAFTRNSAAIRFWLWFAASVKFLIPFSALTALGAYLFRTFAPAVPLPVLSGMQPAAMPFSGVVPIIASTGPGFDWMPWLLGVWALGSAVIAATWAMRWLKLRDALRAGAPLAIAAPMPVKSSPALLEPGLVGIVRPVLLLPEGIASRLTQAELDAVLAHELCHLRRRDNLLAAIHMLVEATFWFHPLVWWLGTRLIAERENACDENVIAAGNDPQTYAEGILKVCRLYVHSPLACAAGISGADLKKRMETIMENRITLRLNGLKKSLLGACAAAALAVPLALGILTASPAISPALAQMDAPHPGTEAALRRQIEGWEKKQPAEADLIPDLSALTERQRAVIQKQIDGWGALKSITFRGNDDGNDAYQVEFEKGLSAWYIGPLQNGKISFLNFGPAIRRTDNGPSPGLGLAIRRELEGSLAGKPAYEIMSPELQDVARKDLIPMMTDIRNLGVVRAVTFKKIDARGWDVYHVTFANGIATVAAAPLKEGKLTGVLHSDISVPHAPPYPGTEASLRRYIESLKRGQPNYDDMTPQMADSVRKQLPMILSQVNSWGALKSIAFKGKASHDMDAFDVMFEKGHAQWYVGKLTADGKVEKRGFHPF